MSTTISVSATFDGEGVRLSPDSRAPAMPPPGGDAAGVAERHGKPHRWRRAGKNDCVRGLASGHSTPGLGSRSAGYPAPPYQRLTRCFPSAVEGARPRMRCDGLEAADTCTGVILRRSPR